MSQNNVEIVKSVHPRSGTNLTNLFGEGAANPRGLEQLASLLTDDFVAIGGDEIGGVGLTSGGQGVSGLLTVWREWLSPWEAYWTEVEDFVETSDDQVLVLVRDHGRLRGSISEVENSSASIWTLRDGKIARVEFHASRAQALRAAGFAE
jgi:ketosteroid isomerase-like protein